VEPIATASSPGRPAPEQEPARGVLESFDPATGALIGSVPTVTPAEVQGVVDDVARVQPFWAQLSSYERAQYLRRAAAVLLDHADDVAGLITREQGKPRVEAYTMEVLPTIDALHWCADNGPEILADERVGYPQLLMKQKRSAFVYEPLGVVGVIAPWNYPWSIPFGEVTIALMAGNGVVLKPASLTPLIGQRIQEIFERAGFPDGLVQTVHGGGAVGQALVESSAAKIFFTGSVEVGRRVGEECARRMKGSVLELGGKDPQIVCADTNLANAVSGAVWGGFANAGQTCSGIERVYVAGDVAERFIAGVVAETTALTVGDPSRWDTEVGPMVSREQHDLVCELVDDALAAGAKRLCGGPVDVPGLAGHFIAPTVLTGVTHEMRIMREEIFGPVLPIVTVGSEEEAIALANDSDFGLGASVWTLDRAKGERIARRLEAGMVWINDHSYTHGACQCAWGGVKESGLGRSHSRFGFIECVNIKTVSWEPSRLPDMWWHPYDEVLGKAVSASARILYGRDGRRKQGLRQGAVPLLRVTGRSLRRALRG
jgi:acyl-CoA reductase-like NAD-dependent aldehyde dehydrogenase